MRSNPHITRNINKAITNCRKELVGSTVHLMLEVGAGPEQYCDLGGIVFMHQEKTEMKSYDSFVQNPLLETIVADRIRFFKEDGCEPYYEISFDEENPICSYDLSLSNLVRIYQAMRIMHRQH